MKKYLILAAAVSMFAACTNTDDLTQQIPAENERIPLTIDANYGENPNVTVRTRSTNQAIQGDTISKYVDMGLFVLTDGQTKVHYDGATPDPYDYEFFNIAAKTSNIDGTNKRTDVGAKDPTTNALVYPSDKAQGINLYAYAPYNSAATLTDIDASTVATNVIAVSVLTDQSTDLNYIKSDVLWGCVGKNAKGNTIESSAGDGKSYPLGFSGHPEAEINGNNYVAAKKAATNGFVSGTSAAPITSPKVIIPMLHRAAKIVVILQVNGMPIDKLKGAKVIVQSPKDGELCIDNGTLTKTSTSSSDIIMTSKLGYYIDYTKSPGDTGYETELAATDALSGATEGNNGVIAIDTDDPADGAKDKITGYVCSAIVMPHTLEPNAKLFDILLADGTGGSTYSTKYTYFNPSPLASGVSKFESGKVYTYTITVKASGLDVVATVAKWADGFTNSGDAVLQ